MLNASKSVVAVYTDCDLLMAVYDLMKWAYSAWDLMIYETMLERYLKTAAEMPCLLSLVSTVHWRKVATAQQTINTQPWP